MYNFKKKQLLEMIATLERANDSIENGKVKNVEEVTEILTLCQQFAIMVGNDIEKRESADNQPIVTLLEEYCEQIYQLSLKMTEMSFCKKLTKKIRGTLLRIKNGIQYDLPQEKVDVVFLPYKASMWDSLESIWIAAKNDHRCNAVVIPIPYYNKNPDGSFGEMHYEGNEFPPEVPIVPWQEYNMQIHLPEVVFIHNPYDDNNYVTSVHPDYYVKNLKPICGILCYVPYFVTDDNVNFIKTGKDSMCVTNGVLYSDYVFVQSENVKIAYINAICKIEKELGHSNLFGDLNKKIISLGSPKFDKVINSKKDDYEIPDSWIQQIANKQIVMLNTTINAFLHHNEKYLDKLRNILSFFKERDDVILWWRPHPLLLSTFESMRPQLAQEYKSIVEVYRADNYGIYDDTADLNRAIAWCDRYYGDRSSVVWLYGVTGRPVLISIINQRKRNRLSVNNWRTGDIEPNDLMDWIEGKEKWKLEMTFKDKFDSQFLDGNSGKRIFEFCIGEGQFI